MLAGAYEIVPKAIIFDLDGTLVDTATDLANSMNYALKKFGQPTHSVEVCKQMIGDGLKMFAQRALGKDSQHLRDEVIRAMKARYRDKCFECSRLYDGISEVVSKLREGGIRLAVLTNKDQDDADASWSIFSGPIPLNMWSELWMAVVLNRTSAGR